MVEPKRENFTTLVRQRQAGILPEEQKNRPLLEKGTRFRLVKESGKTGAVNIACKIPLSIFLILFFTECGQESVTLNTPVVHLSRNRNKRQPPSLQ